MVRWAATAETCARVTEAFCAMSSLSSPSANSCSMSLRWSSLSLVVMRLLVEAVGNRRGRPASTH